MPRSASNVSSRGPQGQSDQATKTKWGCHEGAVTKLEKERKDTKLRNTEKGKQEASNKVSPQSLCMNCQRVDQITARKSDLPVRE